MIKDKEYYEALDKRTNEYKDWKKSQTIEPHKESEGFGDTLEKVLTQIENNQIHTELHNTRRHAYT